MAYCTASDVRLIVNTTLTDPDITRIIETSDAEIDARIGSQTAGDALIRKLSMFLSAITVKTRDPDAQGIGEYSESWIKVYQVWEREIDRIFRLYKGVSVKASEYRHIDESKRYPEA